MNLEKGQPAPDFALFTDETQLFKLSDLQGEKNVVLLFFPAAFTGVCTNELSTVSNDLDAYGADTQVVGISTDTPFTLAEFKKVHALNVPLLSDHNASVSAAYGTKYNNDFTPMELDRISKRSAFVIDKNGTVQYAEVLENAGELPNLDEVQRVLSTLD